LGKNIRGRLRKPQNKGNQSNPSSPGNTRGREKVPIAIGQRGDKQDRGVDPQRSLPQDTDRSLQTAAPSRRTQEKLRKKANPGPVSNRAHHRAKLEQDRKRAIEASWPARSSPKVLGPRAAKRRGNSRWKPKQNSSLSVMGEFIIHST